MRTGPVRQAYGEGRIVRNTVQGWRKWREQSSQRMASALASTGHFAGAPALRNHSVG